MRSWFASNHRGFGRRFVGACEQEIAVARRTARNGICLVALAVGMMVSWGCASQNVGDRQAQTVTGRSEMAQGDSQSKHGIRLVEISLTIDGFGKPPLVRLQGEVILRNDSSEPRWFLIPKNLPLQSQGEDGVDRMKVSAIEGPQPGVLAELLGTGGVWALLLPPGGRARITRLPINYWGELPTSVEIRVRTAREVLLKGKSLQQWFGVEVMNQAQVEGECPAEGRGRLATLTLPEDKEALLVLPDEQVVSVTAPVHSNQGKS